MALARADALRCTARGRRPAWTRETAGHDNSRPAGSRPSGAPARVTRRPQEQHQRAGGKRTLRDRPGCRAARPRTRPAHPAGPCGAVRENTRIISLTDNYRTAGMVRHFLRANMTASLVAKSGLFIRLACTPCAAHNESSRPPQAERPPRGPRHLPDARRPAAARAGQDQGRASHCPSQQARDLPGQAQARRHRNPTETSAAD
jgi:hypothetical protein